jgi:DNA polymerase I-like protein with 3'-5' exonuclease and polymerase domains
MNETVFDVETTTFQKGNPFSIRNKMCALGINEHIFDIEYGSEPYGDKLTSIVNILEQTEVLIGFNIKFDLHWLRRYIPGYRFMGRVWDCQLAEYLLTAQTDTMPSLDRSCERRGIAGKLNIVRTEYWEKGHDTTEVPWDILSEYLKQDLQSTYELYRLQKAIFEGGDPRLYGLFRGQCADVLVLADAEANGLLFNVDRAKEKGEECRRELEDIDRQLVELVGNDRLNWNSGDHLSSVLYGGDVYFKVRVPTTRILKDGSTKHGEKWGEEAVKFPGMVRPLPRSETKPTDQWDDATLQGINRARVVDNKRPHVRVFSTDEATLRSLKPKSKRANTFIELVLKRAGIEKLLSTYYEGVPKLIEAKDWPAGEIHGQFNQCIAITGRLSSSGPNLQNFASETKELFYSRYD